ncbi:MAG TPA: 5-(carboxyamino)imidazole ribonucleotide mutase [Thermodesulfovibrionales bacterium]|nr:5-(carboxyamino)imidazole ribonucleotide mutase [Thermodesulfovibrionales bacterium]
MKPQVLIIMGSDSDLQVMQTAGELLEKFGISYEMTIASAHRTPELTVRLASDAEKKGFDVVIAGAGMAAHLAGFIAAHTTLPVIGVPIDSSSLKGLDSLLSIVQMPPGVPVAAMSIGKAGAKNAAILAAQIIARRDREITKKLKAYKKQMAREVEGKSLALKGNKNR